MSNKDNNEELIISINSQLSSIFSDKIKDVVNSIDITDLNLNDIKNVNSISDSNNHFICRKCKYVPSLEFVSLEKVNYSCSCYKANNITIDEIINQNIVKDQTEEIENNQNKENGEFDDNNYEEFLKCKKHFDNYVYYCQYCKIDLCSDCFRKIKFHQAHSLFYFDLNIFEINQKMEQINKILMSEKKNYIKTENELIYMNFLYLLSVIFKDFLLHPNYVHFTIIYKTKEFIDKYLVNKSIIIESLEFKKEIKINSRKILLENLNNPEIIVEIDIYKSYLNDLTELCNVKMNNLTKLYLFENEIKNIKPLLKAQFKNLEKLNLGANKLGNENIPYLFELPFKKLTELNLYLNNFTDHNIFKIKNNKKNLPYLETLYIGSNLIDWNLNNYNKIEQINIKYDLSSVKIIGLTNGIFDAKSLYNIENFIFTNLEIIYLGRNSFNSLSFTVNLELPSIKEFSMVISYNTEFYPLIKYKTLEIVELIENYISKIDKLK